MDANLDQLTIQRDFFIRFFGSGQDFAGHKGFGIYQGGDLFAELFQGFA